MVGLLQLTYLKWKNLAIFSVTYEADENGTVLMLIRYWKNHDDLTINSPDRHRNKPVSLVYEASRLSFLKHSYLTLGMQLSTLELIELLALAILRNRQS